MKLDLQDSRDGQWHEVLSCDGSARLMSSFFSRTESDQLFATLFEEVPWSSHDLVLFGKKMSEPRLSSWIGDPGVAYTYSGVRRSPEPWTATLADLRVACERATGTRFNSVLANLYRSGDDSMGWHADDEAELGPEPVIASLSFGDERRFDFRHRITGETISVVLPHGSLLVMSGATQTHWKHRIARTKRSISPRVNLTYRLVLPARKGA